MSADATPSHAPAHGDLRRDGAMIVVRSGTMFPRFCVICDQPVAENPLKLKFKRKRKSTGALAGAALGGLAGAALGAALDDQTWQEDAFTGDVLAKVFVCARHRRRRMNLWIAIVAFNVVSLALLAWFWSFAKLNDPRWLLLILPLLVGIGGMIGILTQEWNPWLRAVRFRNDSVWLKGAGGTFLAALESGGATAPAPQRPSQIAAALPPRPNRPALRRESPPS